MKLISYIKSVLWKCCHTTQRRQQQINLCYYLQIYRTYSKFDAENGILISCKNSPWTKFSSSHDKYFEPRAHLFYIYINNGDEQTEVSWWGQIFGTSQLCKPVERYLIAGEAYKYSWLQAIVPKMTLIARYLFYLSKQPARPANYL